MDKNEIDEARRALYHQIVRSASKQALRSTLYCVVAALVLILGAHLAFAFMEKRVDDKKHSVLSLRNAEKIKEA
jgi:hypothetical protein